MSTVYVEKSIQIQELIQSENPDIILCQGTKLSEDICPSELFPDNFIVFRKDNLHGGGVCIAVSSKLDTSYCADLNVNDLEAVWVKILV